MWETWVQSLGWEDPWRRERLPTPVFWPREFHRPYGPWGHKESDTTEQLSLLGFPFGSAGKESVCSVGDLGSIPGLGRSAGEGTGYPLQYSWASLVAQLVKNPSAVWETWVQSLGWEDSWRGKGYPLQYSGLENTMDYSPRGHKESDMTK